MAREERDILPVAGTCSSVDQAEQKYLAGEVGKYLDCSDFAPSVYVRSANQRANESVAARTSRRKRRE